MDSTVTRSAKETQEAGKAIIKETTNSKSDKAVVIGLRGELGSGKTTFVQGIAKGLRIEDRITSPTFVIMKRYRGAAKNKQIFLYHIDCYRLTNPNDLLELGWYEIMGSPQNIVVVEWAERVRRIMPPNTVWLDFRHSENKDTREIEIL